MRTKLKLGTFCSGIGAPEVASKGIADPIWFSEIEPFPIAVLAHHWPHVPNLGDMTAPDIVDRIAKAGLPDVVFAGLPCQPFSIAGLRRGEGDPRNLTSRFVEIADAVDDLRRDAGERPVIWIVENVPGLMSDSGNAFGALLGAMVGSESAIVPPGRWERAGVADGPRRCAAWRHLDAQYFGLAQRRKRVFAVFVGGSGRWIGPEALLPIIDSMSWHSPPRREAGQTASTIPSRSTASGGLGTDFDCDGGLIIGGGPDGGKIAGNVSAKWAKGTGGPAGDECYNLVAHALRAEGFDASEDGTGRGTPIVPVAFSSKDYGADAENDLSPTLRAGGHSESHANAGVPPAVAFDLRGRDGGAMPEGPHDTANLRAASGGSSRSYVAHPWAVRRLTPTECARLQGFSDDHCAITYRGKPAADGPQYKALGNSMAVPCISWILKRMKISMEASKW